MPDRTAEMTDDELYAAARSWFEESWDPELTLGDWWECLAESGWGLPGWPVDWFGKGLSSAQARLVGRARGEVGAVGPPSGIGVMMAGPTIVDHGTEDQKRRFLPDMVTGRHVWCQLFSEPGAGSDLAGIQTRAVQDGDEWIVNGQKVWTSGAQYSRWGDPDRPHRPERPEAQRHHLLRHRHGPGGRRGSPAEGDDRWRDLQRGVLNRCAGRG